MTAPIISGFHPDPSICRVDDAYYLATSSFEYSPGVPIHRSEDLLTWTLVGNALDRPSQLRPSPGGKDTGIYAPTLRHHGGRFWLATTDVSRPFDGQLIVHAEHAEGPWSDPVFVPGAVGIDPDLVWDDDGVAHLQWTSFHPDLAGIASMPIDLDTGRPLGEPTVLWTGTGLPHTEGPHLYRIDGWWYLLVAEGGTERGHVVSIARSRHLEGPYESAPANPILSHRSTSHAVQNTGHGDLVQAPDGSWAMVYLGVRPRGKNPGFHVNGRETFLAGVTWHDGWPVVDVDHFDVPAADHGFVETFPAAPLHPRWIAPGAGPEGFTRVDGRGALLEIDPERQSAHLLATRARDVEWTADVRLDVTSGSVRVLVRHDDTHWYGLTLTSADASVTLSVGPSVSTPTRVPVTDPSAVTVHIAVRRQPPPQPWGAHPEPDLVGFSVSFGEGEPVFLGEWDGRYLSSEVAGGFTGRVFGVEVLEGKVLLDQVSYRGAPG